MCVIYTCVCARVCINIIITRVQTRNKHAFVVLCYVDVYARIKYYGVESPPTCVRQMETTRDTIRVDIMSFCFNAIATS